ncbi:hypothetical protein [Compostibacter hankyongensis]
MKGKLFHYLGMAAAVLMIVSAYLPWIYIAPIQATYSGMDTGTSNFGAPGILNIGLGILFLIFSLIPRIWAKRTNLFIGAAMVAWNIRNYFIFAHCEMGYCPEKKIGLYLTLILGLLMLVAAMLPYVPPSRIKR